MRRSSRPLSGWLILVGLGAGACAPTCASLCIHLRDCDLATSVGQVECQRSCEKQLLDLQALEDKTAATAFDAQRTCLGEATCDELAAGACQEDDLGPFVPVDGG